MSTKRQIARRGLVSIGVWICSGGVAIAQSAFWGLTLAANPEIPTPNPEIIPSNEITPAPVANLQTYTLPNTFSLQIPQDWTAAGTEVDRFAVITNYSVNRPEGDTTQPSDIKTEVRFVGELPDTFVDRELTSIIEENYTVQRYGTVKVNEHTGLRLWIANSPLDYTHQIITFVGYNSGTVKIVTHYNAAARESAVETEILIEQVHDSFELVL